MESNRHASVIAKLMGIDQLPPQQPLSKPCRVLSENYLRKSASISLIEKQPCRHSRSFGVSSEKKQKVVNGFQVPQIPTKCIHHIQSSQEGKAKASKTGMKTSLKNDTCFPTSGNLKNYLHLSTSSAVVLRPNLEEVQNAPSFSSSSNPEGDCHSGDRKHVDFSTLKNGEVCNHVIGRKTLATSMKLSRLSFRLSGEFTKQISNQLMNRTTGASKVRFSRFKKIQAFSGKNSGNNRIMNEVCTSLDRFENEVDKEDISVEGPVGCQSSKSKIPCSESSDSEYDHTVQGTQMIEKDLKNSTSPLLEVAAVSETEASGTSFGSNKMQPFKHMASNLFVEYGHSSCVLDASIGQESLIRPQEDLEYLVSLREGYSSSPNSVLETPFGEACLSCPELFRSIGTDLQDIQMQLQFLKSESEETDSEDPEKVLLSDGYSCDGSVDLPEENRKLVGLFRAEESRHLSYVVDVLDEGGINAFNMQFGYKTWHSPEYPINPSVFEILEKKYDEQTYWEKSERRLLFDRLNSGLKEILQPCGDLLMWAKPLRKRFKRSLSREVIEEELWMYLVNQEKEVAKDLSQKAIGKDIGLFQLQDDIEFIVCEIESFLFDKLQAELVSIENY
ncbi:hypothetical protein NMG60_11018554 [Bertholletia excelsa]